MGALNVTNSDIVSLAIWAVILIAAVIWGHTFRTRERELINNRKYYYIASVVILIFCFAGIFGKGLNFGLDFTGGTILELGAPHILTQTSGEIAQIVKEKHPTYDVTVQLGSDMVKSGDGKDYQKVLVRVRSDDSTPEAGLSSDQAVEVREELNKKLGVELSNISETTIGPTISGELKAGAMKALAISCFLELLYITFRFGNKLRFGFSAVLAVIHDVIVMVGFYAWAGAAVDSSFVAAVLTITGYSLMDTVVVFDRVREFMKMDKESGFDRLCNKAVCSTMTRSINTSLTTVVVCICLYYMGGESLKGFAYALMVGIIAGSYSSIFLASPLLVDCDTYAKKRDAERADEIRREAEEKAAHQASEGRNTRRAPRPVARPRVEKSSDEGEGEGEEGESAASAPASSDSSHSAPPAAGYRSRRRVKGMRRK